MLPYPQGYHHLSEVVSDPELSKPPLKLQTYLITTILGLSAFFSLPAIAQSNQLENFFAGTPPYRGVHINCLPQSN